jgi:hypothetical protein
MVYCCHIMKDLIFLNFPYWEVMYILSFEVFILYIYHPRLLCKPPTPLLTQFRHCCL